MARKKRILVADDSITIQKLVNVAFAGGQFEIIFALDGHDALVKMQRLSPDLVLLDSELRELPMPALKDEMSKSSRPHLIWMQESGAKTEAPSFSSKIIEKPFDAKSLSGVVFDLLEDEETTVRARVELPQPEPDEEVTEKTQTLTGPFSSYRQVEELESQATHKIDLSSKLETIAKEVATVPKPQKDDEDTLRVDPKNFVQPVNLEAEESPSQAPEMPQLQDQAFKMIQDWIEAELPKIAERLLKEEISKIASSR